MDYNTDWVMGWTNRMMNDGWCGCAPIEALAAYMGESGNETVSDAAIERAKEWENDPDEMIEFIRSHRINGKRQWCVAPTWGCVRYCEKWKEQIWEGATDE